MTNESARKEFIQVISDAYIEALALKYFHARITLLTLLDTLSHAANPDNKNNKDRFVNFIDEYTDWDLSSFYSIRQLSLLLDEPSTLSPESGIKDLRDRVAKGMREFSIIRTPVFAKNIDLSISELSPFLSNELKSYIERVRYPCLLWFLRNSVVHELRNPGDGVDFELGDPSPYYHTVTFENGRLKTWELYIPNELISFLLVKALTRLNARFTQDDINPWDAFRYDPKWYQLSKKPSSI